MDGTTIIDDGPKASWKSRSCLSFGEYTRSWSFNGTWRTIVRRLCMWVIISLRIVMNILSVSSNTLGSKVANLVVGVLFGLLSFIFVFWCLTMIDRAHGNRACWLCGLIVGRTHLEIFVGVIALLHVGLLASFWQFVPHSAAGFNVVFFFLCIMIGAYGIFCTKPPLSV
ncbi:hypothetical protein KVR01_007144 [Diaporthe batatas]|uniref:uncharacterized protein n=1 Tax=Diaporthe batatas TaxID=748121 RepID=UPI001D03CD7B|nr:uncharacterized protein KVR01_007144 [Diaporthe batatas]KAG8162666.1 hypothetical protein KVR01_007144 [Diaporthe batatas]